MQIAVLPMPNVLSDPVDRRMGYSINDILDSYTHRPSWVFDFNSIKDVILGSHITILPKHLKKIIHVSYDYNWIFETVVEMLNGSLNCLYTKIITHNRHHVLVSLNSIWKHTSGFEQLVSTQSIVFDQYSSRSSLVANNQLNSLVTPIFSREHLRGVIQETTNEALLGFDNSPYAPLYKFAPSVLESLILGSFPKNPFKELREGIPGLQFKDDRWFSIDSVKLKNKVRCDTLKINHRAFDECAYRLLLLRPTKISFTILMQHALEGHIDLGVSGKLEDVYNHILPITPQGLESVKHTLSHILRDIVMVYCNLYGFDPNEFTKSGSNNLTSIHVEKNIHDEITISIHDVVHDQYVTFYTFFPVIALASMGAGYYISNR